MWYAHWANYRPHRYAVIRPYYMVHGTVRWPYLLNEVDALLQVHAEVNELPLDAFLAVLFLLEDEHVMVEELLKTLVRVVDAQLLERVVLVTSTTTTNTTTLNYTNIHQLEELHKHTHHS